jgi:Trk K+ transport system NAD-binding subunit
MDLGMTHNIVVILAFVAGIIKVLLSVYIYQRNKKAEVNTFFALLFLSHAVWDIGKGMMWLMKEQANAFLWAKISYTGYIVSLFVLIHFSWAYLKRKNIFSSSTLGKAVWYSPMVILLISLWFTRFLIAGINMPEENFGKAIFWNYSYGPIYNYFFLVFQLLPMLYVLIVFTAKYLKTRLADTKAQLKYFIIGSAIPILIGIPTGVILPLMGVILLPHNHILTLLMSIFLAIGILKFRFLTLKPVYEQLAGIKFSNEVKKYVVEPGNSYLLEKSELAYNVFLKQLHDKRMGLIITHQKPEEIRKEYGLKSTLIIWITDSETEQYSVGTHDLEQLLETITLFVKEHPNSVILLDGMGCLTDKNGFQKIEYFLTKVRDGMEDSSLLVPLEGMYIDRKRRYILEKGFMFIPPTGYVFTMRDISEYKLKKIRYIILDYNDIGTSILHEFLLRGIKSTVVSSKPIDPHLRKTVEFIDADPLNKYTLAGLDIDHENVIIIPTFEEDPDNILAINLVREVTDKAKVLAKINQERFIDVAKRAGANEVIPSSTIGGKLVSMALSTPDVVEWIMDAITYKTTEVELMEYDVEKGSRFKGKTIDYVDHTFKGIINVLALRHKKGFEQIPVVDYVLEEGDKIIFAANLDRLNKHKELKKILGKTIKSPLHKRHERHARIMFKTKKQ